ncbi:MAG: 5-formyltetrahydrofolate cyclo-ligase [Candidatus Omnitrophica bacterium]|nr:5-formyltetrahydrofolate cyclo-ligase [Candidatus Omnitrophota bacterium]
MNKSKESKKAGILSPLVELTKAQIRSKILIKLKKQKEEDRNRKSKKIKQRLFRTQVFTKANNIMFYIAFRGEVDTEEMIRESRKLGKIIAVPVCQKDRETLRPCILDNDARLKRGPYGVREPALESFIRMDELDLVIVPGLAFDKKGNRLGRGMGFYDRFLSKLPKRTKTLGLAFDFQILPSVPTRAHDVRINKVLFA